VQRGVTSHGPDSNSIQSLPIKSVVGGGEKTDVPPAFLECFFSLGCTFHFLRVSLSCCVVQFFSRLLTLGSPHFFFECSHELSLPPSLPPSLPTSL
jgi:hypothetical protein